MSDTDKAIAIGIGVGILVGGIACAILEPCGAVVVGVGGAAVAGGGAVGVGIAVPSGVVGGLAGGIAGGWLGDKTGRALESRKKSNASGGEQGSSGETGYKPQGEAAQYDREELSQLIYQHTGEGDIPGRPGVEEIERALENGTPVRTRADGVTIRYNGIVVKINESLPWRSTAYNG
jgi:hypothetical protein